MSKVKRIAINVVGSVSLLAAVWLLGSVVDADRIERFLPYVMAFVFIWFLILHGRLEDARENSRDNEYRISCLEDEITKMNEHPTWRPALRSVSDELWERIDHIERGSEEKKGLCDD